MKKIKKIAVISITLWAFALSSCGLKNSISKITNHTKTPEEQIKEVQTNIIDSIKSTALAKESFKWDSKITLDVSNPMLGKWSFNVIAKWEWKWYTWQLNTDFNISFYVLAPGTKTKQSATITWNADFISTLDKVYVRLNKININSNIPELNVYSTMLEKFKNKWIYTKNQNSSKKLSKLLKNISLKDELSKYSILKVNKKIKENTFDVSLDKKNIATIIYNISKKADPNFSWSIENIQNTLWKDNINGIFTIIDNKYFTFSWDYIREDGIKVPLQIKYTSKKFDVDLAWWKFKINIDKNWDDFNGYIQANTQWNLYKINVSWKLSKDDFALNFSTNIQWTSIKFSVTWNYQNLDKLSVKIPENALPVEKVVQTVMWK